MFKAESKKSKIAVLLLGLSVVFALLHCTGEKQSGSASDSGGRSNSTTSSNRRSFLQGPTAKLSGNAVLPYKIIRFGVPKDCPACTNPLMVQDVRSDYALIEHAHPSQPQLTDLAIDLHAKYPLRPFQVVDSVDGIQPLIRHYSNPFQVYFPIEWTEKHLYGFVHFSFDENEHSPSGRWVLMVWGSCADAEERTKLTTSMVLAFLGPEEETPAMMRNPQN